jgi:hypothetical protein
MISLYIDLTEKVLLPFQIKVSLRVLSLTSKRPFTNSSHLTQFSPTTTLLKEILSDSILST